MEGIALVFALLALLSLIGISIYFYMEFDKHKVANDKDYNKLSTDITDEQKNRLSNLSSIVDQINIVNKDIKTTYDTANTEQNTKITNLGVKLTGVETGFGSLISTTSSGSTSNIPLSSLASIANVDVRLLKNVSVVSGMTIKDVQASGKAFKVCGGTPEKCIELPNSQGNTYLTGFGTSASIVMDAPTSLLGNVNFNSPASFSDAAPLLFMNGNVGIGTISVNKTTDPYSLMFKSSEMGFDGAVNVKGPATFEQGMTLKSGENYANIGVGTTNVLNINSDLSVSGTSSFGNRLSIKSGATTIGTIGVDTNNKLNITSTPGIVLTGDVNVIGQLSENGTRVSTTSATQSSASTGTPGAGPKTTA
jgi:hypothetical protein